MFSISISISTALWFPKPDMEVNSLTSWQSLNIAISFFFSSWIASSRWTICFIIPLITVLMCPVVRVMQLFVFCKIATALSFVMPLILLSPFIPALLIAGMLPYLDNIFNSHRGATCLQYDKSGLSSWYISFSSWLLSCMRCFFSILIKVLYLLPSVNLRKELLSSNHWILWRKSSRYIAIFSALAASVIVLFKPASIKDFTPFALSLAIFSGWFFSKSCKWCIQLFSYPPVLSTPQYKMSNCSWLNHLLISCSNCRWPSGTSCNQNAGSTGYLSKLIRYRSA